MRGALHDFVNERRQLGLDLETVVDAAIAEAEDDVAVVVVAKLGATSISLGAGASGGIFAPSLFMGAVLGGAFGAVVTSGSVRTG